MGGMLVRAIAAGDVLASKAALDQGASPDGNKNDAKKPIHLATEQGSLAIVELLCTRGADANVRDLSNAGRAPLHIAIRKNSPDIVKLLLEKQARPNVTDGTGATPLHTAIEMNDITSAGLLLKYKANVHLKDESHNLPLHIAVRKNNCEIVKMLLNAGASVHIVDASGDWLLHVAARIASTRILEKLKEKGCEVNKRNADGSSPLHLAAESGNLEAVKWFTHNGAKIDDLDGKKKTPEDRAVGAQQNRVVQWINGHTGLRAERAKVSRILVKGDVEALRQLIPHHDIDALCAKGNNKGLRAVHYTAIGGHVKMLEVLKESEFDLQAATQRGLTALHYAVRYNHLDAVKWLVTEAGLRASLRDMNGNSALDMAGQAKKEHIQEYLRRLTEDDWRRAPRLATLPRRPVEAEREKEPAKEVDPKASVKEALASGDFKNVIKLIEKGTDVDTLIYENNDQGMRAVHYAAQSGSMEMLRALKQRKVDLKPVTRKGFTALHCAVLSGQLPAARWLVAEAGLDAACQSKGGETALDLAKILKRTEIAAYLDGLTQKPRGAEGTTFRPNVQQRRVREGGATQELNLEQLIQQPRGAEGTFFRPFVHARRFREGGATQELNLEKRAKESARAGDVLSLKAVVRRGFSVDAEFQEVPNKGWRLLHFAADRGHTALVDFLIQENANVNAATKDGMTPLHLASWGGHTEVIRALLSKRANGNAKTTEGMTAIHLASMGGHVSSMEALTPTCGVVSVNRDGKSALHLAAEYGNLGAVQWLHLQGLDASSRDDKDWTPLQYAKDEGHKKVVDFLEKLEKQHSPQGLTQHEKELKDLQAKLKAKETEIQLLNKQQDLKDRMQERAQAQIKDELQEMREILKAQNDLIARLQDTMLSRGEPEKEEKK